MRNISISGLTHQIGAFCLLSAVTATAHAEQMQPIPIGTASAIMEKMPVGDHTVKGPNTGAGPSWLRRVPNLEAVMQRQAMARNKRLNSAVTGATAGKLIKSSVTGNGPSLSRISRSTCTTNVATGFAPSDIHGAVGVGNTMVVVTNVDIGVYNKTTCSIVSRVPLKTFFNVFSTAETLFDPRVIYDNRFRRFFVTVESRNSSNTDQKQYFAVSTNANGTSWFKYTVNLSSGASAFCKQNASSFWDYPNAGHNKWRWFITANDFGTTVPGAILMINKAPTLSGATTNLWCWNGAHGVPPNIAPPIVLDNSTTATFLSTGSGSGSSVARYDIVSDPSGNGGTDLLFTRPSYPIPAWSSSSGCWQPNAGNQRLDGLDGRFQSASIQSRFRIWNVHTVNVGGFARARAYKFWNNTTSSAAPTFVFTPFTQSNDDICNPSFATGSGLGAPAFITATRTRFNEPGTGNATMIMFSGFNFTPNPNHWRYDTIYASPGTFETDGFGTPCNNTSRGACRWGDYSSTQVDPLSLGRAYGWDQAIPGPGTTQFDWTTKNGQVEVNLSSGPEEKTD